MRVSFNWLKDYVRVDLAGPELAEKLTMAGLEVTTIEQVVGDWVMEIEVTTNRPDCLSIIGVAREAAAITDQELILPDTSVEESPEAKTTDLAKVKVEDLKACPRYTARVITDLKVSPSPKWLIDRLTAVGIRPINLVVDITNFVLMEFGQPLHAFDYDKLVGGEVIVRRARGGEKLLTIDETLVKLSPEMLVIADKTKPVALAGIMGGRASEVSDITKTILLESACFDPVVTRNAARNLGIRTESSYRFERGVDLEGVLKASNRACNLLSALAGASVLEGAIDVGRKEIKMPKLSLRPSWVNKVLGTDISTTEMEKLLDRLQISVLSRNEDMMEVQPSSHRQDLTRSIDLVEEVARLYGYQDIPITHPRITVTSLRKDSGKAAESVTREVLTSCGLNEIITYSLISEGSLKKVNMEREAVVAIENPLSLDQAILRTSLLPGVLETVAWNKNRNVTDVRIFELGTVYHPRERGKLPQEVINLACALTGERAGNWRLKRRPLDFYDLKGVIEALIARLGITDYEIIDQANPSLHPTKSAALIIKGKQIGFLGEASVEVLSSFEIDDTVLVGEIKFRDLINCISLAKEFTAIPKYPSVTLDISIIVREDINSKAVTSIIQQIGGRLVKKLRLFDLYHGPQVPTGHKSLAYSIEYQAVDRTLTYEEVKSIHSKISLALKSRLGAQIR